MGYIIFINSNKPMITLTDATGTDCGTFYAERSTLGNRTSEFFKVSADPQKSWVNGIFHNSRYGIFHLYEEKGKYKLELTSKGLNTPKFRKCTVSGCSGAINKVLQWLASIREESLFMS